MPGHALFCCALAYLWLCCYSLLAPRTSLICCARCTKGICKGMKGFCKGMKGFCSSLLSSCVPQATLLQFVECACPLVPGTQTQRPYPLVYHKPKALKPTIFCCTRCMDPAPFDVGGRVALVVRNDSRSWRQSCSFADIIRYLVAYPCNVCGILTISGFLGQQACSKTTASKHRMFFAPLNVVGWSRSWCVTTAAGGARASPLLTSSGTSLCITPIFRGFNK